MTQNKKKGISNKKSPRKRTVLNTISESNIFVLFLNSKESHYTPKSIMRKLRLTSARDRARVIEILHRLNKLNKIVKTKEGGYVINNQLEIIEGTIDVVSRNKAFLISEKYEDDIAMDTRDLKFALTGDKVQALIFNNSGKKQAEVINIVNRGKLTIVGKIIHKKSTFFLIPEGRKAYFDVFIPSHFIGEAKHNDKVLAEITAFPEKEGANPEGRIIEVFGQAGDNEAEMHSIMAELDLPMNFPRSVLREAEQIDEIIPKEEIAKRRDFRKIPTFTIDPLDAKDFDDAVSIQKLEQNIWEIGVHIADVTHYVKPETALEQEAFQRGTSIYLVDRVVPMLPERLSNGVCSLRPNEEKLTFSCVFKIDENAKLYDVWIGKTIIYSDQRFAYEDAQERIETKKGSFADEINVLNNIALKLRKERFANGSISFETEEVKFNLDEKGKPINVFVKERKEAHKLIEDFMLLANKKVAEFVFNRKKETPKDTMVYRVHEPPNQDKLDQFSTFAKRFGYTIDLHNNVSKELNKLSEQTEGKIEHDVLQQLAIRSMSKAKYTTESLGHFGLGFKHYSHFTSPIRRYPDMMAHRLIEHYLKNKPSANAKDYEEKCKHASEMERRATNAERMSIKYKQVEYMQQFEGEQFDGFVTGVSEYGMYIEIGTMKCEGMVRLADMNDDYYYADTDNYQIVGRKTGRKIVLGEKIKVKVKRTDLERRTIDLTMIG